VDGVTIALMVVQLSNVFKEQCRRSRMQGAFQGAIFASSIFIVWENKIRAFEGVFD